MAQDAGLEDILKDAPQGITNLLMPALRDSCRLFQPFCVCGTEQYRAHFYTAILPTNLMSSDDLQCSAFQLLSRLILIDEELVQSIQLCCNIGEALGILPS